MLEKDEVLGRGYKDMAEKLQDEVVEVVQKMGVFERRSAAYTTVGDIISGCPVMVREDQQEQEQKTPSPGAEGSSEEDRDQQQLHEKPQDGAQDEPTPDATQAPYIVAGEFAHRQAFLQDKDNVDLASEEIIAELKERSAIAAAQRAVQASRRLLRAYTQEVGSSQNAPPQQQQQHQLDQFIASSGGHRPDVRETDGTDLSVVDMVRQTDGTHLSVIDMDLSGDVMVPLTDTATVGATDFLEDFLLQVGINVMIHGRQLTEDDWSVFYTATVPRDKIHRYFDFAYQVLVPISEDVGEEQYGWLFDIGWDTLVREGYISDINEDRTNWSSDSCVVRLVAGVGYRQTLLDEHVGGRWLEMVFGAMDMC